MVDGLRFGLLLRGERDLHLYSTIAGLTSARFAREDEVDKVVIRLERHWGRYDFSGHHWFFVDEPNRFANVISKLTN